MFEISKQFTFEASHQLTGLPEGHKCMRLHGHSYVVELKLAAAKLDEHGFVMDYGDLKPFGDYIAKYLDHQHLNDRIPQPTAEHIAYYLWLTASSLFPGAQITVMVSETAKTWASYTEEKA